MKAIFLLRGFFNGYVHSSKANKVCNIEGQGSVEKVMRLQVFSVDFVGSLYDFVSLPLFYVTNTCALAVRNLDVWII